MNKSLIIACSPFQIICALEAISYFGIKDFDFFLPLTGKDQKSSSECKDILTENGISFKEFQFSSLKEQLNYYKNNRIKRYSKIICGDYIDLNQRLLMHLSCKKNSKIIFVDDGNSTLKIFETEFSMWKHIGPRGKLKLFLINLIHKPQKENIFFYSIFDSPSNRNQIIKNNLSNIKSEIEGVQKGVYVLGTVASVLNPLLKESSIEEFVDKIFLYLKSKYPTEEIYYCPHRRDKENESINSMLETHKINLFPTKVSVEFDFIREEINPLFVIGFGSTALFTLKKIYPNSCISSISMTLTDKKINEEYELIERKYLESNIEMLNVNQSL